MNEKDKRSAIAAAVILLVVGFGFYLMPSVMNWLATFSPWLSYSVAILFVLAFFAIFWLRGRHQSKKENS